ncbi:LIM/homeobox protein LMX-1.2 isoform X2 [Fopius arisanus]|uniref:LIM/homeobox protein LMX-1.2 isoform X2 n=1 Tax=Fopius arisanus TaxID=64838 RepID=A0A9R1TMV2_9HYME|nr:PREDICTED: LIM/homeobox protein LMX-1.2-like isoform X2 [Fopius arisanus]
MLELPPTILRTENYSRKSEHTLSAMPFRQSSNSNLDGTVTVKTESGLLESVCASCGRKIVDRFLMRVADRNYHEDCLACAACARPLAHSCYTRDLKFYCRADYERIYGVKCGRCMEKISCSDFVLRTASSIFHVECFACCMCGQTLPRGAHYVVRQGQPICRRDYEHEYFLSSPQDDDLLDENRPRDGRRGPKRPRTILTSAQRRQFKASFELSPKPCRKVREALAKDTGLSVRVVQVWFQNQRAKMKKLQRKAKTDPTADKEPKEERRPDSPHSDHNTYPGNSGESFCSSDLSLDGTEAGFDIGENESTGTDGTHQNAHSHHAGSSHEAPTLSQSLHAAMHNPIDKLFMMQDSYFRGDHA